jgi:hypothetical protein
MQIPPEDYVLAQAHPGRLFFVRRSTLWRLLQQQY